MKPRTASLVFTNGVVGVAVLLSAFNGNPWTAAVISLLFVFTAHPRWRGKIYRALVKAMNLAAKAVTAIRGRNDRCDPQ